MSQPPEPRHWTHIESKHGPHMMIFRPRYDTLRNPRTDEIFQRLVLETPDWVNVVALTPERELLVVRQYRFGTSSITTEIPGGVIDPGEEHAAAAERELREETGYTSASWTYLGCVQPNPAFHTNLCHHWLALDAMRTHELELDSGEDIVIDRLPLDSIPERIRSGEIRHALVLTALSHVIDLRLGNRTAR